MAINFQVLRKRPGLAEGATALVEDTRGRPATRNLPVQTGGMPVTAGLTVNDGTSAGLNNPSGGATKVLEASDGKRARVTIQNNSATARLEIGGADLVYGQGVVILPNATYSELDNESAWYALAAPGTSVDVRTLTLEYL